MKDGKKWGKGKQYNADGVVTQKGRWERNKPLKKMSATKNVDQAK